jgi:DNA-binding XRE family transcriptional regulator
MAHKSWKDVRAARGLTKEDEGHVAALNQALEDAMTLADLRRRAGMTQVELAAVLGLTQGRVSRIEREREVYLTTLREYVEALGGQLELAAVFPDLRVPLALPEPAGTTKV